ncbi:YbbR-like domain-containing protein [Chakrabartyella piscis]|uniref:CdaR family protein n=1 Tax=Chakrabartyella piscis TaxID=2918914 RepID=UPI00295883DF|nr:CdaR family protein [Chakrabartyella piscis]
MKKFQELLMKDLGWKLLSIAIAAIMWVLVINVTQPVDNRTYSKTIRFTNVEALSDRGLTVSNAEDIENEKVDVQIEATRTSLDRLNSSLDWLSITVDLSPLAGALEGDEVTLPVDIAMTGIYSGYNVVSKSPATVDVLVEKLSSKELPVQIAVNGDLSSDNIYSTPEIDFPNIFVQGASSAVDQVDYLQATINANDISNETKIRTIVVAYDAEGVPVKGVTLSVSEVTVSYHVYGSKRIPIHVDTIGEVADGYELRGTSQTPLTLEIMGAYDDLMGISSLQLEPVDVTDASEDVEREYYLSEVLPAGIYPRNADDVSVHVTASIQSIQSKAVTLLPSQIAITGEENGYVYELLDYAQLTIQGGEEYMDDLDETKLTGSVDVSGLSEGEHRVLINLSVPIGLEASDAYIEVLVSLESAEEETPEESEEETTEELEAVA